MMCRGYVYNFYMFFLPICLSTLYTFGAKIISLYLLLMKKGGKVLKSLFISVWISTCPVLPRLCVWIRHTLSTWFSTRFQQLYIMLFLY